MLKIAALLMLLPAVVVADTWQMELADGAQGRVTIDDDGVLHATKTAPVGSMIVRAADPMRADPGVTYTFRVFFHSDDAPLGNLLLLRMIDEGEGIHYDAIDRTHGWVSQSLLINSTPDAWIERQITYRNDEGGRVTPTIVLWGNPCNVQIKDIDISDEKPRVTPNSGADLQTPYSEAEAIADRVGATARVETRDGRSVLIVNGELALPAFYKITPYTNEHGDEHQFGRDGIDIITVPAKLGSNNNTGGAWRGPNEYDTAVIEAEMMRALQRNPQAQIILEFTIYPYVGWGETHRDGIWRNADGQGAFGYWGNVDGFTDDLASVTSEGKRPWWYPSYQSVTFRQDASRAIAAVVERLQQTPLWKAVIGAFIDGGHDGQFIAGNRFDYSPDTVRGFRGWCEHKYGVIEHLNRVWRAAYESFDDIHVPIKGDISEDPENSPPYIAPEGHVADYRAYLLEASWRLRDHFAGAFEQAAGKDVITLAYCGSDSTFYARGLLELEHLDGSGAMSYYPYRNPGYPLAFMPAGAFDAHGKLFFQELDIRSWVGSIYAGPYATYIGAGRTPDQWRAVTRKLIGVSLARGLGWWYYDMNRYFNDPAIHEQIRADLAVARQVVGQEGDLRPDVAVVIHNDPTNSVGPYYSSVKFGGVYQKMQFESAGVPFDIVHLEDLLAQPDPPYKLYVFFQTADIPAPLRDGINDKLKRDGNTLVWLYDAGYINGSCLCDREMSELLGMRVRIDERYARLTALVEPNSDHPYLRDVQPMQGMSETMLSIMSLTGRSSFVARYQPFWINDANATTLMRYRETGQSAMAVRRLKDWTSVYIAAPNALGATMLNNIATEAGAYVAGPAGQSLYMNGRFASLHGLRNGSYTFNLPPGRTRVVDADTGAAMDDNTLNVAAGETYWLLFD